MWGVQDRRKDIAHGVIIMLASMDKGIRYILRRLKCRIIGATFIKFGRAPTTHIIDPVFVSEDIGEDFRLDFNATDPYRVRATPSCMRVCCPPYYGRLLLRRKSAGMLGFIRRICWIYSDATGAAGRESCVINHVVMESVGDRASLTPLQRQRLWRGRAPGFDLGRWLHSGKQDERGATIKMRV